MTTSVLFLNQIYFKSIQTRCPGPLKRNLFTDSIDHKKKCHTFVEFNRSFIDYYTYNMIEVKFYLNFKPKENSRNGVIPYLYCLEIAHRLRVKCM